MNTQNKVSLIDNSQLISEWDWDKNSLFELNPQEVTCNSSKKAWWICPNNHSYKASIWHRTQGGGCPYCAGKKVLVGFNDLETWCIRNNRLDLIEEFDRDKNEFPMNALTKGSGKEIWWKCPNGHSYCTSTSHRINMKTGCGICSHKRFLKGYNDLQTTHPEIACEFDVNKNGITPDQVMAGSNRVKYWFICPKGHSYSATLLNRKKGRNCPICAKELHVSFPEKAILFYLQKMNINIAENYHAPFLNKKEIDIYLSDCNFAVEYDGRAWHKNIQRDLAKDKVCQDNGISLIRIREEGCPIYESTAITYYIDPEKVSSLEQAICFVVDLVNQKLAKKIVVDINLERDKNQIYQLLNLSEKKNSLLSVCPDIEKYWDQNANGTLSPYQISYSSIKTIYLSCPKGHKWTSSAHSFTLSPRCPICSGERVLEGFNDLGTTHPHLKMVWSEKNEQGIGNYSYGSNQIVIWKCDTCHGEYRMRITDKAIKGFSCPYCNNRKLLKGVNDLATQYPELAAEWSSLNNTEPENYLPNSREIVYWECERKHVYQGKIVSRVVKHKRCPYCNNLELLVGFNDLQTCNPILADQFDSEKNLLFPKDIIYGGTKSFWWKCEKGHSYSMSMAEKKRGYSCPICSNNRILQGYNDLQTVNPSLAEEFSIERNGGKTAQDYVAQSGRKVWWKCSKCSHEWQAQIIKRNKGSGCPICAKEKATKKRRNL